MGAVGIVAWRELRFYLGRRDVWFVMLGVPLIIVVALLAVQRFGGDTTNTQVVADVLVGAPAGKIGYVDDAGIVTQATTPLTPTTFRAYPDQAQGEAALRSGNIDVLYTIPADFATSGLVTRTVAKATIFPGDDISAMSAFLLINSPLQPEPGLAVRYATRSTLGSITAIGPEPGSPSPPASIVPPLLVAFLLYGGIFTSAGRMLHAIKEEKESRTIEILVTSIEPKALLGGKILGLGVLGLLQVLAWSAITSVVWRAGPASADGLTLGPGTVAFAAALFVLGFVLYATLLAGVGAINPQGQDLPMWTLLITGPALLPALFSMLILSRPHGLVARLLSFFPLTAAPTLLLRQLISPLAAWEIALGLGLLTLGCWLALTLAGRMFRAATLLTGLKITPTTLWRALVGQRQAP